MALPEHKGIIQPHAFFFAPVTWNTCVLVNDGRRVGDHRQVPGPAQGIFSPQKKGNRYNGRFQQMLSIVEITIILVLILLNGVFAMAEFALVSAKRARLQKQADAGDSGAAAALRLMDEPTAFFSTVQIGITLIGIFAGAFGGATVAKELGGWLGGFPVIGQHGNILGITMVVLIITYLTLVFGELVPKRIGMSRAEAIAAALARPMQVFAVIGAPLVFILSRSTDAVLHALHVRDATEPVITEDEIKLLLTQGAKAGVFAKTDPMLVEGVFRLDDRRAEMVMTRRPEIIGIDLSDPVEENLKKIIQSGRSHFPVHEGDLDTIVGMIAVRDVLAGLVAKETPDIRAAVTKPLIIPGSTSVLAILDLFKKTGVHVALVTDEYGSIEGIITLHDILESIVGVVRSAGEPAERPVVVREDGSWLISGDAPLDELKKYLPVLSFPGEEKGQFRTIAGLVLYLFERIPKTGEYAESGGLRYEVVDMNGNRIDKVLVSRAGP